MQPRRVLAARERERGGDRAAAADDRAVLEQRTLGGFERVEPGRDETVQRRRAGRAAALARRRRPERCASWTYATSSSTKNGLPPLRSSSVSTVSSSAQPSNSACTSCAVAARSSGSRCSTNALWRADSGDQRWSKPGRAVASSTQRRVAEPAEQEPVGELEHGLLGPVEVGEPEHERRARAQRFEERERGADAFVARAARVDARTGRRPPSRT